MTEPPVPAATGTRSDTTEGTSVPDVSIIVVSYNTRELTCACLESVYEQTADLSFELILLDNDSHDGSADAVAERFPQVHLIRNRDNVGFAEGNNVAVREAGGRYLLLLNPDTVVLDGAIQKLVAFARARPGSGIWGGRTVFGDGSLNPTSCWSRMTTWSLFCRLLGLTSLLRRSEVFNPEAIGDWQRDREREVDIVTGCLLLITRSLWDALDGFDSTFFMYGEEADLCLRAREHGARPAITPDACIVHYGAASEPVEEDRIVRLMTAKIHLVRRHTQGLSGRLAVLFLALWPGARALAWALLRPVRRNAATATMARTWASVWRRRSEWLRGYESGGEQE